MSISSSEDASSSPTPPHGDAPIEGGEVREFEDLHYHEARHKAETARLLSKWLLTLLGVGLATQYVLTAVLAFGGKEEAIKSLNGTLNAWLPAVSSLVSAAVTYYFTKEKT